MMKKLQMQTAGKIDGNVEYIAARFPNCVTEGIDEHGKAVRLVDFALLKAELSNVATEDDSERYQFSWADKKKSILAANAPSSKTLRPCRAESVDFDTTKNLYIEGDNLDVLKLLQETYMGKVKMIYIDPPYNTGNDFVYEDDFSMQNAEFRMLNGDIDDEGNRLFLNNDSNGRFHTDWLNMIYPRLKLARDLLTDDGVIFISIDDNEVHNLRKVCDEIFGAGNFAAQIPWQSRLSVQNDTDFSTNHEYILAYAKVRRLENRRLKESNADSWYNRESFVFRPIPLNKDNYENPDNDPRGAWKADPFDAPHVRPNLTYPIINPKTGDQHLPPSGRHWRISREKFASALADNRIVWGKNGTGRPQLKVFYEEKKDLGSVDNSWFSGDKIGTATAATQELQKLFAGNAPFDTPKPTSMIKKLCEIGFLRNGDIVLDFFSGSAATADAVMQMNANDGGNRKFILMQIPEQTPESSTARKEGYATICDIGKERIRRAGEKIKQSNPMFTTELDIGFRVLKADSSNMKPVYYNPDLVEQDLLLGLEDNIKDDRTPEDLLFQVMLDLGADLASKIECRIMNAECGIKVFDVGEGNLICCFDKNITKEVITDIAKRKPLYAVFRDAGFDSDSTMVSFDQIFATYSPTTERRVI